MALGETLGEPFGIEYKQWDPVARIEVSRIPPPDPWSAMIYPCLIGDHPPFLARFRRMLTQNNNAFTYAVEYDGRRESLRGIEETIYAAAYQASPSTAPRVVVIGVGGGFDILTALYFERRGHGGRDQRGHPRHRRAPTATTSAPGSTDPRVRLVDDEGRHFLATHADRFDVIQLSGVDSYSGTPGAAHVFSENYLYTAEAFDLYLSRLTADGILNVMRLEYLPPREMLRALVTAVGALRRAGVASPADHVVMVTARNGFFTALLVKRAPFTPEEIARVRAWADASPFFTVSAAPGRTPGARTPTRSSSAWRRPGARGRSSRPTPSTSRRPPTTGPSSSSTPSGATSARTTSRANHRPGHGAEPAVARGDLGLAALVCV